MGCCLTKDMHNEKKYQSSMRPTLMAIRMTIPWSAPSGSVDDSFSLAMRWSSSVLRLRFFCWRLFSCLVNPVSSSSRTSSL